MLMTSKLEVCRTGLVRPASIAALIGAICFVAAGRVEASPYYSVTDMGREFDVWGNDSGYYNGKTGISYEFTNRPTILTDSDRANLPTYDVHLTGWPDYHEYRTVTMQQTSANDSGTVVGNLVKSMYRSNNFPIYTELGYTVKSSDGTYSPFVPLADNLDIYSSRIILNQANQILINPQGPQLNGFGQTPRLLDLNTGMTTPLTQLIPPEILEHYQRGVLGEGLDDRGDILVLAYNQNFEVEALMLTPPGLDPPAVPEPSTLLVFAAGAVLAIRAGRRRAG